MKGLNCIIEATVFEVRQARTNANFALQSVRKLEKELINLLSLNQGTVADV